MENRAGYSEPEEPFRLGSHQAASRKRCHASNGLTICRLRGASLLFKRTKKHLTCQSTRPGTPSGGGAISVARRLISTLSE